MNFFPLCTAMVWPTISGTIVERRGHVLTTFFSNRRLSKSIFFIRCSSTNGPFLSDLPKASSPLLLLAPLDDEAVGQFVVARLVAARRLAPGRGRIPPSGALAFATAERMIHGIHRYPPLRL